MTELANSRALVTVVIAVKNGARFVASAIESALTQTYTHQELLVVDGHSSDSTAAIIARYPQVRYVLQPGQGVADAYNHGIAVANGDFLAFLSHDDVWLPEKLEMQMAYLLNRPLCDYTVSRVKFFLEPGFEISPGFRRNLLESEPVAYIMETLVARKSLFAKVGVFDTHLTSGEDVDWFARAKDMQIEHGVIDRVLVRKRVHDTNLSLNDSSTNKILLSVLRKSISRKREKTPNGPATVK